jgi:uncharacterized repeat protein (TIGR01451 family)
MNNLPRAVLAFVIAVAVLPLSAQPADFAMVLDAQAELWRPADRVAVGQTVYYLVQWNAVGTFTPSDVVIEVDVPGTVTYLYTSTPDLTCTTGDPVRCTFTELPSQGSIGLSVRIDAPGVRTATARVIRQGSPDADPSNDADTHTLEAFAHPSLELWPSIFLNRLRPGERQTFSLTMLNRAGVAATNATLTVTLPAGGTFVAAGSTGGTNATCGFTSDVLTCTTPSLSGQGHMIVEVAIVTPERTTGEDLVIQMAVTSAEEDFEPADNTATYVASMIRQLVVSNVQDEGSGSLRQALHDVNALCEIAEPCAVLFQIPAPVPPSGWFTIQPRSPLPEIVASLELDGSTQTRFTGDTNPDGPEIEINGAFAQEQAGLRLRAMCDLHVSNLAVNGFPGAGIEVRPEAEGCSQLSVSPFVWLTGNYLGTDPRGRVAKPNHRGLNIFSGQAYVAGNVIGGNRRAGIYSTGGSFVQILQNRIGIGTGGSRLGNGAGIFIDLADRSSAGADIEDNVIAYNDGMAVARTREGEIHITKNSIFDNLQQGIDVDLDGPSAPRASDLDVPNAPVLFDAIYDVSRGATIVRGRIDSVLQSTSRHLEVYASSRLSVWGTPQAEQSLASLLFIQAGQSDFELVVPGDHRGKWITATFNVTRFTGFLRTPRGGIGSEDHQLGLPTNTSELSNAVMAQ